MSRILDHMRRRTVPQGTVSYLKIYAFNREIAGWNKTRSRDEAAWWARIR